MKLGLEQVAFVPYLTFSIFYDYLTTTPPPFACTVESRLGSLCFGYFTTGSSANEYQHEQHSANDEQACVFVSGLCLFGLCFGLRASGLRASGLRASGLRASGLRASGLRASRLWAFGLRASGLRASGFRASDLRTLKAARPAACTAPRPAAPTAARQAARTAARCRV